MSRDGLGEISIDEALEQRHRAAERAQAEADARRDREREAGARHSQEKAAAAAMVDRGLGFPAAPGPLRVTCANRKCGARAALNPRDPVHDAQAHGGRLDPSGDYWCSARCAPATETP